MPKSQNIRILIADDERSIRQFLKISLSSSGYDIFEAATGKEVLEGSVSFHPDVIILDLGLPDMDGLDVIRDIRIRAKTPIIILSVREEVPDKVAALDAGADDYLTKPFSITELLARLKAVMRRLLPADQKEVYQVDKLAIDITKRQVLVNGNPVNLTPTEYDVLKLLILHAGRVLTHKQILQEVWNKDEALEGVFHLLRVTISNLRSKIEPDPDRPVCILTEPGIGYRLRSDK
ncbi:MAG: response regulator transcription factor [bacterium]|nr:response regulator transcription factor [bacterium]